MAAEDAVQTSQWLYGAIWTFYACFYALYFGYVAGRFKPDLRWAHLHGSRERLLAKRANCYRIAGILGVATVFELIRSSNFTVLVIGLLPTLFGIWVMFSIWREVFRSEMPIASRVDARHAQKD